jgi:hypothetical protein
MLDRFRRRDEPAGAVPADDRSLREHDSTDSTDSRDSTAVAGRQSDATAVADPAASSAGERRFTRDDGSGAEYPGAVSGAATTTTTERPVRDRDDARATPAPLVAGETMAAVRARQRERFGGISWGSAFFGLLSALGLAAIVTAILAAAGVALGLADQATGPDASTSTAQTIGLGGGIALLVVLAIAWYCGGYVAGRMARFDGGRQGVGVWVWTIVFAVVIAALAAVGGSKYDVFQTLNLPSLPVNGSTLTSAGAIAGAAAVVVTLLAAVLGGKAGDRFHRRVDRVAHDDAAL